MKIIGILLLTAFLLSAAFGQTNAPSPAKWQNIVIGTDLKVDCLSKKLTGPADKGVYPSLDTNIRIKNNQTISFPYNLDVFFLARVKDNKLNWAITQRDKKTARISLDAGSSTNLNYRASFIVSGEEMSAAWIGYIVRLSASGKPIKTVASSPALEKLANDPARMEQLAAGKSIPAK